MAAVVLAGCAESLIRDGHVNQKKAEEIEAKLASIRELAFTREVPLVVTTPDKAEQMIVTQIARDHSDEELRNGSISGVMAGLYPPHFDLKGETLALLRKEVIGFYNPATKQMVIVETGVPPSSFWTSGESATRRETTTEMVLAHELTHALQDQHYRIDAMLRRVKDNDDETLALKSVAEGDATIAGFGYIAGHLDEANIDSLVSRLEAMPTNTAQLEGGSRNATATEGSQENASGAAPDAVSVPLLFQYSAGSHFVAEAWKRGGWAAVDKLYRDPPRSSQQILQPELYFDHPSPPLHIELSGYQQALKGWKKVDDDTYGELLLKLILERNLPAGAKAFTALQRWTGDRIITLQKAGNLTLLWLIAFRDSAAASDFADAYNHVLDRLPESQPHGVDTRGSTVFVAIGPGATNFRALRSGVWKASRVNGTPEVSAVSYGH